MFRQTLTRALLTAGVLLASAAALANPYETRLPNGMKLIVKEDRRAPSVVHMVWYRSGAMDEPDGVSGVAHVLEHMMFKGTKKVGPGEFNRRVAAVGGRDNAFTSKDYTAYFQQVPPARLGEMMALEADRMQHLVLTDDDFRRELAVVKEERRLRTDDQPRALVHEQLQATALQSHPYRRPIIGWMPDLEAMQPDDARAWYRQWYTPNNATLVVVGDVDHRAVFRLAAQHYGPIAARPLPPRRIAAEPEQRGPRQTVVRAPAELPYVALAWPVPALPVPLEASPEAEREAHALEVLAAVLDGYDGARLNRQLVREQRLAVSAGAGYDGSGRGPALFYLDGVPAPGHSAAELEAALLAELQRIRDEGISAAELGRVKAQAIAAQVYKRDSLMGQAMEIGFLDATGLSWRDEARLLDGLRAVSAEDVQAAARRHFSPERLNTARLDPLALPAPRAQAPSAAAH